MIPAPPFNTLWRTVRGAPVECLGGVEGDLGPAEVPLHRHRLHAHEVARQQRPAEQGEVAPAHKKDLEEKRDNKQFHFWQCIGIKKTGSLNQKGPLLDWWIFYYILSELKNAPRSNDFLFVNKIVKSIAKCVEMTV